MAITWFGGTGGATDSTIGAFTVVGQLFAAPASGDINQARAWLGSDSANVSVTVAVYANSGGVPGALLGQSDPLALTHPAAVSLRTLTFSTPVTVVSGTSYFLTTWSPTENHKLRRDPGVGTTYYRTPVVSVPNPFGTASSFGGYQPNLEAGIETFTTPVADFTGTPLTGGVPLSVAFTDTSANTPTSWAWDFGDGGTSTSQNPTHNYTVAGVYDVDLVATNAAGTDTETKTGYVVVDVTVEAIKIKTSAGWIELATV